MNKIKSKKKRAGGGRSVYVMGGIGAGVVGLILVGWYLVKNLARPVSVNQLEAGSSEYILHIGKRDAVGRVTQKTDWEEFDNRKDEAQLLISLPDTNKYRENMADGAMLKNVRPWIGHSTCDSCHKGVTQIQKIGLENIMAVMTVTLQVFPGYVTGTGNYEARIVEGEGQIVNGGKYNFLNKGYQPAGAAAWTVTVVPKSRRIVLALGNWKTSGTDYLYFDAIRLKVDLGREEVAYELSETMKKYDRNYNKNDPRSKPGDWYKWNVTYPTWSETYVITSYARLLGITKDSYWAEKLIDHLDLALSQRTIKNGHLVWVGDGPRYKGLVYQGFNGAILTGGLDFANQVARSSSLAGRKNIDGKTYQEKAETYVAAFEDLLAYFESGWREDGGTGYYIFRKEDAAETGYNTLNGKPQAFNLLSGMMNSVIYLSQYYRAVDNNDRANFYEKRVKYYTQYLKNNFKPAEAGINGKVWPFSTYYSGDADDLGHSNLTAMYLVLTERYGYGISRGEMQRIAQTPKNFMLSNGALVTKDRLLINGKQNPEGSKDTSKAVYYWPMVARFDSQIKDMMQNCIKTQVACKNLFVITSYLDAGGEL